jgi:hypothetical protein
MSDNIVNETEKRPYRKPTAVRFWRRVEKTEGCWLWTGGRHRNGYGKFGLVRRGHQSTVGTHIVAYELHYGPIPEGLCVLHTCDTRLCVRPDHLFLGTKADNNADMAIKERGTSRLTAEQVKQIRTRYAQGGVTMKELGKEYGVNRSTVGYIIRREHRSYVT